MPLPQPTRGENYRDYVRRFLMNKEARQEVKEMKK